MIHGRRVLLFGVLLLSACQRPPADASAVGYRVVDEGRAHGNCVVCVQPTAAPGCIDGGQAAEIQWHVPPTDDAQAVRIEVRRADQSILEVVTGPSAGQAALPVPVLPTDRISVVSAGTGAELAFTRVAEPTGCALPPAAH